MSRLDDLIRELCPDGVEFKELGDKSLFHFHYGKGNKIPKNGGAYPVYGCNGIVSSTDTYNCENVSIIGHIGSAGIVNWCSGKAFVTYNGTIADIKDKSKLDSRYLYYVLLSLNLPTYVKGSQPFLSASDFAKVRIPIPPLEVQQEIVRLLDDFTAKTSELQNKINEELEARKKQYECYKDMLLNNSENFIITTIGNISESVTVGIANSATQAYSETGVTMLRNQNIKENYLDDNDLIYINNDFSMKYKNKSLKENDILVTRTGYPGVACVVPKKYENAQTFTTLIVRLQDLKKTNPKYVCYYINSLSGKQYVRKMQSGAAQQNFGATALSKMPINIPDITTQNYIVKIFENFDSTHSKISMALLSELESRQKQYEYYRDKLLTFKELK